MILKILLWAFFAYMLYKLIFSFLLPILKVSGQLKKQMREFQQNNMQSQGETQFAKTNPGGTKQPAVKEGDYIDFEEIKN